MAYNHLCTGAGGFSVLQKHPVTWEKITGSPSMTKTAMGLGYPMLQAPKHCIYQ